MNITYPEIGICGLSCLLCPNYYTDGKSRCSGCKTESRMAAGCPFITCAIKKKRVEFCWDCPESPSCKTWSNHREQGKKRDSFKCYQTLEKDIDFIQTYGVAEFEKTQRIRAELLQEMLQDYNEGRSKRYYCIAATVLEIEALQGALHEARSRSKGLDLKGRSKLLHTVLDKSAAEKNYVLKLRK